MRTLLEREVDAIILVPSADWRQRTRPLLKSASTAVVLADKLDDRGFDQVGSENTFASQAVVAHLITTCHSRIGMISGLAGLSTSHEREADFRLPHERHGIPVDDNLIWLGRSTVRGGFAAATEMLQTQNRPTALFLATIRGPCGSPHRSSIESHADVCTPGPSSRDSFSIAGTQKSRACSLARPPDAERSLRKIRQGAGVVVVSVPGSDTDTDWLDDGHSGPLGSSTSHHGWSAARRTTRDDAERQAPERQSFSVALCLP